MIAPLLLVFALGPPVLPGPATVTPDMVWTLAYRDLYGNVKREDRPYTRYFDCHYLAAEDRDTLRDALDYGLNATSFRTELARVEPVGDYLLRMDTRRYAWDYGARSRRLAEYERRGATFAFKDDAEKRRFLNAWELLIATEPYGYTDTPGYVGWIDPGIERAGREQSRSLKFVARGDWALARMLTEPTFGGVYSDLLMFPKAEADFYKAWLVPIKEIERDNQLLRGGAVLKSLGVAVNNRELQMFPTFYGHGGVAHGWRTLDANTGASFVVNAQGGKDPKSVLRAFKGTIVHDGRESFGTLGNGIFWWQLYDNASKVAGGTGNRVDVVPETIAQVQAPLLPVRETRVYGGAKCLECHVAGVKDFEDVVRKIFASDAGRLDTKARDRYLADDLAEALEDYYASDLGRMIRTQQDAYLARLKEACGMDGPGTARAVVGTIEAYLRDPVNPEQVARDIGYSPDFARLAWMAGSVPQTIRGVRYQGNPNLAALAAGEGIPRQAYEESFGDAIRSARALEAKLAPVLKAR